MPSRISGQDLIQLKDAIVQDFDSSNWRELGALTNMIDEVERHPRLLRSLSFGDPDYDGLALTFLRRMIGKEDENLDTVVQYIHKTCGNAGENVSSEVVQGRKIVFSPTIFDVPCDPIETNLISVMMPFDASMAGVYNAIVSAAQQAGFECQRADNIWDHSTVIQDVFSLIFKSYIVVCDFTGKNPNVFYEAGISHTLGKHVVPITQSEQDVPFDLRHHRFAKYLNNGEGLERLKDDLVSRFSTLADKRPNSGWI
ncbi:hypothetical protein [Modicisalibacter radicis]|uniref:hypothetical protein n=1 Tax=Halomonas sp. EAR18 TaxID=2518972 RepID=UPI00109C2E3A|nr:hypothetical protein [Halomonas sp. EAR18]